MPLLTAAPLPLLYGCRITRAPAAAARSPVSSVEPSSTTRISSQRAADARSWTTDSIEVASLNAGITIDVCGAFKASAIGPRRRSADLEICLRKRRC